MARWPDGADARAWNRVRRAARATPLKGGSVDEREEHYMLRHPPPELEVNSFGFRFGTPEERGERADLIVDVRELTNPHHDPELRKLTGLHPAVIADVLGHQRAQTMLLDLRQQAYELHDQAWRVGAERFCIWLGCTGGRHRSVVAASWLATQLRVVPRHCDLEHDARARAQLIGKEV